ncbi:MAG: FecR family protein [Rhodoferax sp.]
MHHARWLWAATLLACGAAQAQDSAPAAPSAPPAPAAPAAAPLAATAVAEIGRVKTLAGQASIQTGTQRVGAAVGTPVYAGSVVHTDKGATLGLSFRDGTLVTLGSDTRFSVDEYQYDPHASQFRFGAALLKGALSYLSGAIAKSRPEGVSVRTPTGVIGVRGTHFAAKVEPQEAQP